MIPIDNLLYLVPKWCKKHGTPARVAFAYVRRLWFLIVTYGEFLKNES